MKNNSGKRKIPGKKGAIARLVILALTAIIGVWVSIGTLGSYIARLGFWQAILDAFAGCGEIFLMGAVFWIMFKWIGFIAPKSFYWGKCFWQGWVPLTWFGLYIKFCIWLCIVVVPCSASTMLFGTLLPIGMFVLDHNHNPLICIGFFLLSALVVALLGYLDVRKLRRIAEEQKTPDLVAEQ